MGGVRGEIFVDLVLHGNQASERKCLRRYSAGMQWGDAKADMSEVRYDNPICEAGYIWAWATPLAKIEIDKAGFSFSIDGIKSGRSGGGDCSQ